MEVQKKIPRMGATEARVGLEFEVEPECALESEVGHAFEFASQRSSSSLSCRVRVPELEYDSEFECEFESPNSTSSWRV